MGYMVAILLIQMDKADAFTVMRHILTSPPYEMKDFFTKEMKGLKRMLYVFMRLLLRLMPKLYNHLLSENVFPVHYATHWFMTVFSTRMPFELTLRIWDIYFIEG